MRYWKLMAHYNAETQAYSAAAGALAASPFTPVEDSWLVKVRVIVSREAATSLTNHVVLRLTCTNWKPNQMEVGGQGTGIQTAPAFQNSPQEYDMIQPCRSASAITIEGIAGDATQVTNQVLLYGLFDNGGK